MQEAVSVGDRVGDYEITGLLSAGGMSQVWRARHATFRKRQVAIKILRLELCDQPEIIYRFKREARVISKLRHPNILRVHRFLELTDRDPPLYCMVMELLHGCDLSSHIAAVGALEPAAAVSIAMQVADALSVLHGAAIIHRDVKPANIFLAPRPDNELHVKLIDFGLVKGMAQQHRTRLTGENRVAGTPEYMTPEQFMQEDADARSDVYSLGASLYEMLAGAPPYGRSAEADSYVEFVVKLTEQDPKPIGALRPAELDPVSPALEAVVWRCLQKDRNARFSHAAELSEALYHALNDASDVGFTAEETTTGVLILRPVPPSNRLSWILLAVAASLLLTTIGLLIWRA